MLKVQHFNDVSDSEQHTAELRTYEHCRLKDEIATEKLKSY
jgi:hypothetical protein